MYCSKCGAQIIENAKFCSTCGTAAAIAESAEGFSTAHTGNPYEAVSASVSSDGTNAPYASPAPEAVSYTTAKNTKPNPFAFISAGIMAVMLILYFVPWFIISGFRSNVFGCYISQMPLTLPDDTASVFFLIPSTIGIGFLIAGIVMALIRKSRVPLVFALGASVAVQVGLVFFCFTREAWHTGVTIAPIILYLLTFVNIAFAIPAGIR